MRNANNSQKLILAYSFVLAFSALLLIASMFLSPSEPGNSIFLGLSLSRLALVLVLFSALILLTALFFKALRDSEWTEGLLEGWFGGGRFSSLLAWLTGSVFILGWIGTFLPWYRAGLLGPHWNRIQPIMIFILAVGGATLTVFAVKRSNFSIHGAKEFAVLRGSVVLFLVSLPFLVGSIFSKYQAYLLEDFWYGAGVPLLPSQLILALLAAVLLMLFWKHTNTKQLDFILIILLYVMTAILWAREPLQRSFMFPGPYAPNHVLYPFADAATFDMASQFGEIGQGIIVFNNPFFERTLYISFLIYLHSLFGQNYETLMAAQAVCFAVLPSIVYAIGRSLNLRSAGIVAALITMLRGANSIAASRWIDLASPKMTLTDFPTAIAIALLVLLICKWLKQPAQKWQYALWVGGAIGLTLMLRTNGLIFLPLVPLYVLLRLMHNWKNWLVASLLIVSAVIAITLPWELRNVSRGATFYSPIVTKIKFVLQTRYPSPSSSLPTRETIASLLTLREMKAILPASSTLSQIQAQACQNVACFAPKHFMHNIVTSILALPTSPVLDDLRHTVKESYPFWRGDWDGIFSPAAFLLFLGNVFLIAMGVSLAWKRQRLAGLTPLAIFMFYNLSNAFARTSGGRYIVPIDWILTFYYAAGIFFLIAEFASIANIRLSPTLDSEDQAGVLGYSTQSPLATTLFILILLFGVGALVPLAEKVHAPRYANANTTQLLQQHEAQIARAGFTMTQLDAFLQLPDAELTVGRTLYPRSYKLGQGEIAFTPYTILQFPRTAFMLIGSKGSQGVVLPGDFPKYFPHAADALVIGCKGPDYIDALAVIFLDGTQTIYTRLPVSPLTCPLKQPVCQNNAACE